MLSTGISLYGRNQLLSDTIAYSAEAETVVSAADIVDVFVYDTRNDSDGGAWRFKIDQTSWFTETLNTATRGATRRFPVRALIVQRAATMTIYDLDDSSCPMWMVFDVNQNGNDILNSAGMIGMVALNGYIFAAMNGMRGIDFISDAAWAINTIAQYNYGSTISDRNAGSAYASAAGIAFTSAVPNAIAAFVPSGTPLNASRLNLPEPTIDLHHDAGTGRLFPGAVGSKVIWDFVDNASDDQNDGVILSDGSAVSVNETTANIDLYRPELTFADAVTPSELYDAASTPALLAAAATADCLTAMPLSTFALGQATGLNIVQRVKAKFDDSLMAHVTNTYNTGWMPGDIKLALSESSADVTDLVGGDLVTNGDFASDITSWTVEGTVTGTNLVEWDGVGQMRILSDGNSIAAYQSLTTSGKRYKLTCDVTVTSGAGIKFTSGTQFATKTSTGAVDVNFVAGSAFFYTTRIGATDCLVDNIIIRQLSDDRSVAANHPVIHGTITRTAVA
jgi:hypothetical protein